jgi:hypothetical protein
MMMERSLMMKSGPMKVCLVTWLAMGAATASAAGFPEVPVRRCSADAVLAGTVCLDKYETSVWRVPRPTTTNTSLVRKIQLGRASRADLVAGGATQLGTSGDDYAPCTDDGQNCANDVYAVSLPSETPSTDITWFQAQEACANAGKRLPSNAEWQVGVNGTPDPGPDIRPARGAHVPAVSLGQLRRLSLRTLEQLASSRQHHGADRR